MKKTSILIIGILVLSFFQVKGDGWSSSWEFSYANENEVIIEIKCPSTTEIGEIFNIEVWVHPNGNEIGWWYIHEFHWTKTKAKATGDPAKGGYRGNASIIGSDWRPPLLNGIPIWTNGTIDNDNGIIHTIQSMCSNDTVCPVTSSSLLCTIPFRALSNGICNFYISQDVDLVGLLTGPGLDYTVQSCYITIGEDGGGSGGSGGGSGGGSQPPYTPPEEPEEPESESPVANAGGPYSGYKDEMIQFDATQSTDDGVITLCEWEFEDDVIEIGTVVSRYFTKTGKYTVNLTVYDDEGLTDTDFTYVLVKENESTEPSDEPPEEPDEPEPSDGETNETNGKEKTEGQIPIEIVISIILVILVLSIIIRIKFRKR